MDKKQAMAKVNKHVGCRLLNHHNTTFAKVNSAKDVWWINVDPRKLRSDWHIILIKKRGNSLIWLRVPAGSISAPEKVFRVRQDKGCIDLEISSHCQRYMKDVK